MKVSVDFGRWTTTKAALAVAGLLAVGGIVGSALAISPTISTPLTFQGGAEFRFRTPGSDAYKAYTVPAGKNFLLTDLMVTNRSNNPESFSIYTGAGGACTGLTLRIDDMYTQAGDNVILAFQTGIGFPAGTAVCVGASHADVVFNGRGFLFTAPVAGG